MRGALARRVRASARREARKGVDGVGTIELAALRTYKLTPAQDKALRAVHQAGELYVATPTRRVLEGYGLVEPSVAGDEGATPGSWSRLTKRGLAYLNLRGAR